MYFDLADLELWLTFDCGSDLYYYFGHEYVNHKNVVFFTCIQAMDQTGVVDHCRKIDPDRHNDIAFGKKLYDLLGQQFNVASKDTPDIYKSAWNIRIGELYYRGFINGQKTSKTFTFA